MTTAMTAAAMTTATTMTTANYVLSTVPQWRAGVHHGVSKEVAIMILNPSVQQKSMSPPNQRKDEM